jgi:glycosyltransferase involved in cell wall biosynthesis
MSLVTSSPGSASPFDPARPLRILHAVFSSRIAGSERYCIDLANQQAALGHEVHVAGSASSPLAGALAPKVRFHAIGRLLRGWRLRRLVRRLAPDVCHGHLSTACKALGRARHAPPRIATLHVGYKRHQHARLDGLICVNRAQLARIEGYEGMIRSIPNWLPVAVATARPATRTIRSELGLGPDTFVVGAVGRLHPSKGTDLLVRAFRAAAPANAALVLVGEGPQRAELEQLAAGDPRIHFAGHRNCVQDCLHGFDLFVSPSREESFGLAILEAMNAGLPVVATAAEGPAEHLRDQPIVLVPLNDEASLAAAIGAAAERFAAGQLTSVAYDLSAFDPALRVGQVMDFYRQLLAARKTEPVRDWVPATAA